VRADPPHAGSPRLSERQPRLTTSSDGGAYGVAVSPTRFSFDAELWEHDGPAAWFFVSLPEDVADDIDAAHGHRAKGFGSLRVDVRVGTTAWSTSIFPDSKRGTYVLPVKKQVRTAEGLTAGSVVTLQLAVVE
jgi:hypothetical protein